jgi:hypothetical protein
MGAKWNQKILSPIANCNDKAGLLGLEKVRSPDGGGTGLLRFLWGNSDWEGNQSRTASYAALHKSSRIIFYIVELFRPRATHSSLSCTSVRNP